MIALLVGHWIWLSFALVCFAIGFCGFLLLARPEELTLHALGRISGQALSLDNQAVFTPTGRAGSLYAPAVNRLTNALRRLMPSFSSEWLTTRLLVAGLDTEPAIWLAEGLFATVAVFFLCLIATHLFGVPSTSLHPHLYVPPWAMVIALIVPLVRYGELEMKVRGAREGVRSTLPQLFTIAATVARVTNSIEGPNGLLSYMVNLIDSPAAEVLRKVLIRAASTNRSVEEIMDEFSFYYKVPALQGLAASIRLSRRKGGAGLPQAIANASIRLSEAEIDHMVNAAAIKSQISMMVVIVFNMPGLMVMLLAPAALKFYALFSTGS